MVNPSYDSDTTPHTKSGSLSGMENNFKKAVTELLVLHLLHERAMYISEITAELARRSGERFQIIFPYAVIYRLIGFGYIHEIPKQRAPDGRLRQYYEITPQGTAYLQELQKFYTRFSDGVAQILGSSSPSSDSGE